MGRHGLSRESHNTEALPSGRVVEGTFGAAFDSSKFPRGLRLAICSAMGCDEQEDAEIVGSLPQKDLESLLDDLEVEGRPPTRIEKAKVTHLFRNLRSKADPPPVAVPKASGPQPIVVNIASNDDKLVFKDYIDPTSKGTINLQSIEELAKMRRRYEDITGAPVLAEARPSDEQLPALSYRVRPQESGHWWSPFA